MGKINLLDVDYDIRDHIFHVSIGRPRRGIASLNLADLLTAVSLDKKTGDVVGWIVHDFPETNGRRLPLSLAPDAPAIELRHRHGRVTGVLHGEQLFDIPLIAGRQDVKVFDWSALAAS